MQAKIMIPVVILIFVAGFIAGQHSYQPFTEIFVDIDYNYSAEGFVPAAVVINGTTVHLIGGCYEVSFDVTADQAYSITRGLENAASIRPLTHDILKDIMENFGIEILQIQIDRYDNDIYYATIFLRSGNRVLELDARPSDSIALALRTGKLIYFKQSLFEERGYNVCLP